MKILMPLEILKSDLVKVIPPKLSDDIDVKRLKQIRASIKVLENCLKILN